MKKLINILLAIVILAAAGGLMYPTVSDQYNKYMNNRRIYHYDRTVQSLPAEDYRELIAAAQAYNETLQMGEIRDVFTEVQNREEDVDDGTYMTLLNVDDDGIIGYIEIPKIGVRLPIYHGTGDYGLERGVGHMEGTALPVGGPGTHCGLAGHRALPSARLFTDLNDMEIGDLFFLSVLGETLVYQVDKISVVLPHELEYMAVEEDEDLVTLVTCTPYGVNTHRLLVRGSRTSLESVSDRLAGSVDMIDVRYGALLFALPVLMVGLLMMLLIRPKRRFGIGKKKRSNRQAS